MSLRYKQALIFDIMQRRKMISVGKTKNKLIIDRGRINSIQSEVQEVPSPISIVRIGENKQNSKRSSKMADSGSLRKNLRTNSCKRTVFNVRNTVHIKRSPSKQKNLGEQFLTPATQPSKQPHLGMDQFLEEMSRKLKANPHVFHFSGDLTISALFLQRIIRTIIEEIGYNSLQLESIIQKVKAFAQNVEEEKVSEFCINSAVTESTPVLAICAQTELCFSYQAPPRQSEEEEAPESTTSKEDSFIFSHLRELDQYILQQSNKILHDAFRRHKYLEEELFAYADMVSISKMGATTYTTEINIGLLQTALNNEMRQLNRELVQGKSGMEEKGRLMRDYVLRVREGYTKVVQELMRVIDRKTELARNFVDKVLKWEENYLTRKEYLGNLKRDYCRELKIVTDALKVLKEGGVGWDRPDTVIALEESVGAIHRIFLLGNSFY